MDLEQAIADPRINVFDIVSLPKGKFDVYTYRKPGETKEQFESRNYKNLCKAMQLKTKKP